MFSFTPTWRHFLSDIYVDQGSYIVTENAQISVCHGLQNCANLPLASERLSFQTTTTVFFGVAPLYTYGNVIVENGSTEPTVGDCAIACQPGFESYTVGP